MTTAPAGDGDAARSASVERSSAPHASTDLSTRSALRVLIVDDLVDAAESLAILLRKLGYQVRTAHDGFAALEAAADYHPQAILLDLAMPKLNGFHVAKQLRDRPSPQLACLIAISGYGQPTDIASAKSAGFDYHFIKPVAAEELDFVLQRLPCNAKRAS